MYQQEEKGLTEQVLIVWAKALILHLIHQNDYDTLKELGIQKGLRSVLHLANLNFLEHFNEIEFDMRISPLICAAYLGRLEIVKLILSNGSIDVDLASEDSG